MFLFSNYILVARSSSCRYVSIIVLYLWNGIQVTERIYLPYQNHWSIFWCNHHTCSSCMSCSRILGVYADKLSWSN